MTIILLIVALTLIGAGLVAGLVAHADRIECEKDIGLEAWRREWRS